MSFLTEHLGLKILALILAAAVYAHVYTENEQEAHLRVPLQVSGLSPALILHGDAPDEVEVLVRGSGKQLLKLRMQEPRVVVDLSGVRPGRIQRMLSPADVLLPVGTEAAVEEILDPRMVEFAVDTLVERVAEVRVALIGDLDETVTLTGPISPEPNTVTLRGPLERIHHADEVVTEALDLGTLTQAEQRVLPLVAVGEGVEVFPDEIRVTIPLAQLRTRTFSPVRVRIIGLSPRQPVSVEPDSAWIVLSGPAPQVDSLMAGELEVLLPALGLGPGRHSLAPEVDLPLPDMRLLTVRPARFLVVIGEVRPSAGG